MSAWAKTHLPCPNPSCGSSDAYCIDTQGCGFCFSCRTYVAKEGEIYNPEGLADFLVGGVFSKLSARSLAQDNCEFWGVKIIQDPKTKIDYYVFPYNDLNGNLQAQKLRRVDEKNFRWVGEPRKAALFGADKFSSGRSITIVGGEFDAMAFRQLMGDYPVVSVKNGENTIKDIKENLEYFNAFDKVYVCLDNDETGREWAPKIAELFEIGHAKIVNMRHEKDPNEYLKRGLKKEFTDAWWQAADFTPAGIESASQGGFESLFDDIDGLELFPYPYDNLNETTFGLRKGEMVTVVSGSGVGKSAFVGEVAYKLHSETKRKIGMLMLEESTKKTKLRMMSMYLSKPLHLTLLGRVAEKFDFLKNVLNRLFTNKDDYEWSENTKKELRAAWEKIIEKKAHDGEQQLWLFNHFGSNSIDTIVNRIDAMVTGLGCEFIFLDHISIVVSDQQNADERKALDELATKLRTLVQRRNFALIIVSHLRRPGGKPHEEGGETSLADIRGTAGIGQLSDVVIGLERNGQHVDEYLRNVTKIRVLKNRFAGFTGLASYVHYDIQTGRLSEVDAKEIQLLEKNSEEAFEDMSEDKAVFDDTPFGKLETERTK